LESVVSDLDELTATARQQAQRLQGRAATELKRAEAVAQTARSLVIHRAVPSAEIVAVRSLLGNPQTARQAIIASVILAPPVGL
jgi:hypothetical protein